MKIGVLGGGISGLSLAYYLQKKDPSLNITILEKSSKLGGVISTSKKEDFLFEQGPHTFNVSKSQNLLALIKELGLEDQIITTRSLNRYIYANNRLQKVSMGKFLPRLLLEWMIPIKKVEDESVYDFVHRRLGKKAVSLFDALFTGIYAGDIKKLSARSCLGLTHGSFMKSMLKKKRSKGGRGLFTLRDGMETLASALVEQITANIVTNCPVENLEVLEEFDKVFCALPVNEVNRLFSLCIPTVSLAVVSLGYQRHLAPPKGFGYLIPRSENEDILGVIFDSEVFPEQNNRKEETRFTVMLDEGEDSVNVAKRAVQKHLQIETEPDFFTVKRYPHAIPQYEVGHQKKIEGFLKKWPTITFVGNYLEGISLSDCISLAKKRAYEF